MEYKTGNDSIKAYLAEPDDNENHPAIIVIHEIFGLDDHTKSVAERFANQGYIALAPDLFTSHELSAKITKAGIMETMDFIMSIPPEKQRDEEYRNRRLGELPENKRKIIMSTYETLLVNRPVELLTSYLSSAVDYLRTNPKVTKIGSAGFCFGGGMSINLGCTGKVDATVIFYGDNPEPLEKLKNVKSVLGLYAGEDHRITSKTPELLGKLIEYNKPVTVKIYPGTYHAFFNNTRPKIYNEQASKDAWEMTIKFFESNLF